MTKRKEDTRSEPVAPVVEPAPNTGNRSEQVAPVIIHADNNTGTVVGVLHGNFNF